MDVDDMFDLMKSLEGTKSADAINEVSDNKTAEKPKGEQKIHRGAKPKDSLNKHVKIIGGIKPKAVMNQKEVNAQKKRINSNFKGDNRSSKVYSKDVDDMFDVMNSLDPKDTKQLINPNSEEITRRDNLSSENVDDMFSLMSSMEGIKPKINDNIRSSKYVKENTNLKVDYKNIKYENVKQQSRSQNKDKKESLETDLNLQLDSFAKYQLEIKVMSIECLERLCGKDISQSICTLLDTKSGFLDLFYEKNLTIKKIFCIMNLLGKICSAEELRFNQTILSPACNPGFLEELQNCIGALPTQEDQQIKEKIATFLEDVLAFIKTVVFVLPMTASHRMRKVLLSAQINIQHFYELGVVSENIYSETKSLWDQLDLQNFNNSNINTVNDNIKQVNMNSSNIGSATPVLNIKPPNDFRRISVYPTKEDLNSDVPFLRENIVHGSYANVDHYLDVQFRLYKEDFMGPLREGLQEYKKNSCDPSKRINNIRHYLNVRFVGFDYSGNELGITVQFSKTKLKHITWRNSKRLLYGSLLMFSNDDFISFFLATVSGRDLKKLKQGLVTVKFIPNTVIPAELFSEEFIMLESEVFFEPYYQVLTVLKEMSKYSFPMEDYIVHVNSEQRKPGQTDHSSVKGQSSCQSSLSAIEDVYIIKDEDIVPDFSQRIVHSSAYSQMLFHISEKVISHGNLNSSQSRAVKAALASAFSVIQGPPGTGKTFIALKVASTLLRKHSEPMLVICYTNHALDQFLEGLLPFTNRLVRIGRQSKSEELKRFNIKEIRKRLLKEKREKKRYSSKSERRDYYYSYERHQKQRFYNAKEALNNTISDIMNLGSKIKSLLTKLLSINCFKQNFNKNLQRILSDKIWLDWLMDEFSQSEQFEYKTPENKDSIESEISSDEDTDEETDKSDTESSVSDYIDFWDSFEYDSDENDVYYERKRHYINRSRFIKSINNPIFYEEDHHDDFVDLNRDDFVDLNFEIDLQNVNMLIEKLNPVNSEFDSRKCNSNQRKFKSVRYEIIDEINSQIKYLDNHEIKKLECLDIEDLNIDDELEKLLISVRNKMEDEINKKKTYLATKLSLKPVFNSDIIDNFKKCSDIWLISPDDRWMLYHYWKNNYREKLINRLIWGFSDYDNQYRYVKMLSQQMDVEFLRKMEVIGLTTTCAARLRTLLEQLGPKIVIIEEAAEVFEAHIVSALTKSCEQVILIGDHEQLRPSPSMHKLAKKYKLDISLFERMIRNGMCCYTLETQHRMRPEIVSLIVPAIYKKLDNHESVLNRPDIRGVASNVYFVTHNVYENTVQDSASRRNIYEGDFIIAFCMYLLHQGYPPDKITILTTYSGQMFYMQQVVKTHPVSKLHSVRITVVDNYQGEENDIILLSLVRSNKEGRVGFLATKNRICVALSRARNGLFIIGNMDQLTEKSTVWQEIKEQLQKQNAIGPALPLRCPVHSHHITRVSCAVDFKQLHNGGCTLPCNTELKCGHRCRELCHVTNRNHHYDLSNPSSIRCNEIVEQMMLCGHERKIPCYLATDDRNNCDELVEHYLDCGHAVMLPCQENVSRYRCLKAVEVILPCEHKTELLCYQDPTGYKCMEIVPYELELCGHIVNKCCWVRKVDPWLCEDMCDKKLPCGHYCEEVCHQYKDPDHLKIKCTMECTKNRKGCSLDHKCRKLCHEICEPCNENVRKTLPCGHTADLTCKDDVAKFFCEIKCEKMLPCGHTDTVCCGTDAEKYFCPTLCNKTLPCGHEIELPCGTVVTKVKCMEKCSRTLNCRHHCQLLCSELCVCNELVTNILPQCGHELVSTCDEFTNNTKSCEKRCEGNLGCGHPCTGLCGEPCESIKCKEPCSKLLPCNHPCTRQCGEPCELTECQEPCSRLLNCGHPCKRQCLEPCGECDMDIVKKVKTDCGHDEVLIKCSIYTEVSDDPSPYLMMYFCNEPCTEQLPCNHFCVGRCGACMQGNLHVPCVQKCHNKLICGHMCDGLCRELCRPCTQPCLYSCQHGPCRNKCGEPCHRCQMKCEWTCPHEKCTRRCYEMCDRNPCNEPCPKTLPCGDPCMGFCGEVCPTMCRVCDNLDCPIDERFVMLEDCGHSVKTSILDEMFQVSEKNSTIFVKTCPVCDCIISKTKRYRNLVRMTCKNIGFVKDIVVSNLREINSTEADNVKLLLERERKRKDEREIKGKVENEFLKFSLKKQKAWIQDEENRTAEIDIYLQNFSNLYKDATVKQMRGRKLTLTFLSYVLLVIINKTSNNLEYKRFNGFSLKLNPRNIKEEHIAIRRKLLIDKMKLHLMNMNIHAMIQFYLELQRLEGIIYESVYLRMESNYFNLWEKYSVIKNEEVLGGHEINRLHYLVCHSDLSANKWAFCPQGHIVLKSEVFEETGKRISSCCEKGKRNFF